jgi:hypothetical protein
MYFLFINYFSQLNPEVQPDLVELAKPSSKEYDSDYSDDDADDDNEMDELSVDQMIFYYSRE